MNVNKLYAIVFKESGEILTPASFKKYWPNYGQNNLYGWRPAKKIYYTEGRAKAGFAYIPDEIKGQLCIAVFTFEKELIDGAILCAEQNKRKIVKELELTKQKHLKDLERKRGEFEKALKTLEDLGVDWRKDLKG